MVLLMLCMGLTSCDDILGQFDNPFGPLSISVNSIDLDADEMTLTVGDVGQLIATVGPENATDKTVTWTSSNESVATVDATGKVTAVAEGTATIKAKAGSISTTCVVTVKAATVAVTSVTLDKTELALAVGDAAVQLTATVKPDNATDADVDWSSSDQSVATVDGSGLVTAVADGTATITAKAGDKTATCVVTVKKAGSISYTTTAVNKTVGDDAFTNALTNNGDGTVSYASSNTAVATVNATSGQVTIVGAGETTITATVTDGAQYTYATKTATYTVTVSKPLTYPIALSAVTSAYVGSVVTADGYVYPAKTAVSKTAVGILGKVTETGHGLILALQNAPQLSWNIINGWTSVTTYAGTTLKQLPALALGSLTSYTTLGSTTVSNWCVAQKSDYEAIFKNLGSAKDYEGYNYTYDANVNAYITTGVGGTAISGNYWSATLQNFSGAYYFDSNGWDGSSKGNDRSLRPVLGF